MFNLNPIDVLKQRKLKSTPPHFVKMQINEAEVFNGIEDWVKTKLKGRYYMLKRPGIDTQGKLSSSTYIGFEDPKELTFFMLACPQLRRN